MNIIETATNLLNAVSLTLSEYPAIIEQLEVAAYDVADRIAELQDRAARREEMALKDACEEPNETARKAARCEFLRSDGTYREIKQDVRAAERVRVQVVARAERMAREYRHGLLNLELSALRMRA